MNILVLCTGNSARSILLETILNTSGRSDIRAYSAGSAPAGQVHEQSLRLLGDLGHDISGARSKSWDEFAKPGAPELDIVITVSDNAAAETCPVWFGVPVQTHWGVPDPAAAQRPDWPTAFQSAYDTLSRRAAALLALPLTDMDAATLRKELDDIGKIP
ncbi:MAG: arsenate reductase ArsC [Marinosulfonomonas sp.]